MCGTDAPNGTNGASNGVNVRRPRLPNNPKFWVAQNANCYLRLQPANFRSNPYQPVGDFLSNVGSFKIIESTLRGSYQHNKHTAFSTSFR